MMTVFIIKIFTVFCHTDYYENYYEDNNNGNIIKTNNTEH